MTYPPPYHSSGGRGHWAGASTAMTYPRQAACVPSDQPLRLSGGLPPPQPAVCPVGFSAVPTTSARPPLRKSAGGSRGRAFQTESQVSGHLHVEGSTLRLGVLQSPTPTPCGISEKEPKQ